MIPGNPGERAGRASLGATQHGHRDGANQNGRVSTRRRARSAENGYGETAYERDRPRSDEGRWRRLLEALCPDPVTSPRSADEEPYVSL
jgi:hypothetical protein